MYIYIYIYIYIHYTDFKILYIYRSKTREPQVQSLSTCHEKAYQIFYR